MRHAWEIVIRLRPTIFAAAMTFVILSLPSQMLELYLIDIETVGAELLKFKDIGPGAPPKTAVVQFLGATYTIWSAIAAGLFAVLVLWLASVHLVCLTPNRGDWDRGRRWLAAALVVLIALAPVLGVLFGLNNIRANLPQIVPSEEGALNEAGELLGYVRAYIVISGLMTLAVAAFFSFLTFTALDGVAALGQRMFSAMGRRHRRRHHSCVRSRNCDLADGRSVGDRNAGPCLSLRRIAGVCADLVQPDLPPDRMAGDGDSGGRSFSVLDTGVERQSLGRAQGRDFTEYFDGGEPRSLAAVARRPQVVRRPRQAVSRLRRGGGGRRNVRRLSRSFLARPDAGSLPHLCPAHLRHQLGFRRQSRGRRILGPGAQAGQQRRASRLRQPAGHFYPGGRPILRKRSAGSACWCSAFPGLPAVGFCRSR